jgi:[calcium/calmodulin-dependent protein kinase] kinase
MQVNQYRIGKQLGAGSFGRVYLAHDEHGTAFAIKAISTDLLGSDSKGQTGLRGEIWALRRIQHPNCLTLHEVIDDQSVTTLYMVQDYCDGGTLADFCGQIDLDWAWVYMRDMFIALQYLHSWGIAHRDIKPENILLYEGGNRAKLGDFGLLSVFGNDDSQTKTAGTVAFFSPEMLRASKSGNSFHLRDCDVWASGVTMYLAVFGGLPFDGDNLPLLVMSILQDDLEFNWAETSWERDEAFEELISGLLQKDPADRTKIDNVLNHDWMSDSGLQPVTQPSGLTLGHF